MKKVHISDNFIHFRSTLKPGLPPPLPPKVRHHSEEYFLTCRGLLKVVTLNCLVLCLQPRLNSSSEELGLNDEKSLTVRRFPNSENGPSQVARRQSTPEGHKVEHSSPDYLSVSVSSPGLLSHASDPGKSLLFPFTS